MTKMGIDNLVKQINNYYSFTETELQIIKSKFEYNTFKNKDFLLREGGISTHIHFIEQGLIRVFYLKDGKEITTYLSCDSGFVSSYSSFINQSKAFENIQCLENSRIFSISYTNMQALYAQIPAWQKIGRILAEQNLICLSDRILKLHSIPAKEKYTDFLKTAPEKIVQRTPLIHIASFLGITPESLSRIRKQNS